MQFIARSVLISASIIMLSGSTEASEVGVKVGSTAEHFTLKTMNPKLSGKRMLSSRRLVGPKANPPTKALGLTFGASYCEPCKKELKILAGLADTVSKQGSTLAAVVIDKEKDGIELMRKLVVDDLKVSFPVLSDRFGILARRYRASTLPMMVVINSKGVVEWTHAGLDKGALKTFLKHLGLTKKQLKKLPK